MGAGIAQVTATAGYETVCYDVDADALTRGQEHVTTGRYGFERGVERGKLTREDADAARARLSFTASFDDAANVDVVIEAVPEKLELKQQVFRDLDAAAPAGTILASNTSGFPIGQIAGATARPELVIGWRLMVNAKVAIAKQPTATGDDAQFYAGKVAAARFYAKNVLPGLSLAKKLVEQSDLDLMELSDDCW